MPSDFSIDRRYCLGSPDSARHGLACDLIEAIKKWYPALVRAFLAKGAYANACDKQGSPAILWAVGGSKTECLKLLLEAGMDSNVKYPGGLAPIALAVQRNRRETLDILLTAGATEGDRCGPNIHGFSVCYWLDKLFCSAAKLCVAVGNKVTKKV